MQEIISNISIIGAGNLAWSLIPNLQKAGFQVNQLISRSEEKRKLFQQTFYITDAGENIAEINPQADLIFLTVSDQAITRVGEELASYLPETAICVHTSGSTPLSDLSLLGENTGVFYPLQSFTRNQVSPFEMIPLFLEGSDYVLSVLKPIAKALSENVYIFDSEERRQLHLGAVWVNNFTNLMYRSAGKLIGDLPFDVYRPLIEGHLEKVFQLGPEATQTGPAVRGDVSTLKKHLALLEEYPELRALYLKLSQEINPGLDLE